MLSTEKSLLLQYEKTYLTLRRTLITLNAPQEELDQADIIYSQTMSRIKPPSYESNEITPDSIFGTI